MVTNIKVVSLQTTMQVQYNQQNQDTHTALGVYKKIKSIHIKFFD